MKKWFLILFVLIGTAFCFVGCTKTEPQRNEYDIVASFDAENETLSCTQKMTYFNSSSDSLEKLEMFLYANSFADTKNNASKANFEKVYEWGESYGDITIKSILMGKTELLFSVNEEGNILTIDLPEKLAPQKRMSLKMDFEVHLAHINHRLGFGDSTINLGSVFPVFCVYDDGFVENHFVPNGDPFYSDISNYVVEFSYPENYVLACCGNVVANKNGYAKIVAKNVRDFCLVLSAEFDVISASVNGVQVNYFFYDDENAEQHLGTAVKAIKFFSETFGDYDYGQLSVVKCDFCFGGMEYPNLVMISDAIADDLTYDYVIVHEIAHQWWYGMVGNNEFEEGWLDESLTEYSSALFFEEFDEYRLKYDTIISNAHESYKQFVEVYSHVFGQVDERMLRALNEFETEPEYVNCVYTKGVLLYDSLREMLGKRKFEKCVKTYFKKYKCKNAKTEDLVRVFCDTSKCELSNFFESWISGKVVIT